MRRVRVRLTGWPPGPNSADSKDDLKRRIEEASKHCPIDQLALSPQCGFASGERGNKLTVDDEVRKLELVVEVAREVWG